MNDKVSGVGALSFWEACSGIRIKPMVNFEAGAESYVFNHETDKLILPGYSTIEFLMRTPLETSKVIVTAPSVPGGRWPALLKSDSEYSKADIGAVDSVGHHVFTFSSMEASSSLEVFIAPDDLTQHASYVLDDFDQGPNDLLFNYSRFYKLQMYYPGKEWGVLEQAPIHKVTYDSDAPYTIDFMADGVLVMNGVGVSSAEGLPFGDMKLGDVAIRIRYKGVENPYFGEVNLTIVYKSGVVLRLPIEVVKLV
ncbi:UNVERIFIED_ORG: hypothetical protein J2W87_004160 [Pseudomonas putida]|nr:hypothetical protein [Pseudomonas putida]